MAVTPSSGAEPKDTRMRRVLLIAYYFPPAGGPAVQRILRFAQHLPACGWAPVVLTVREGAYPNRDLSLLEAVPPSIEVHRTPSWDPLALYARLTCSGDGDGNGVPAGSLGNEDGTSWLERLARWVRANLFVPDARIGWWPFAVYTGRRLLSAQRFDAILTSGPPHSVHLIGRSLHRATGVPWVADFRDPWTDVSYYDELPHTAWARRLDASLERVVLREASAVTTVSPSWKVLLQSKAPGGRYAVVENGFEATALVEVDEALDEGFVLAHVGKLYASRNPTALWDALAELRAEGDVPKLRLRLIGTVDPAVRRSMADRNLEPIVEYVPFVAHEEALRLMARSALLLLVIERFAHADGMITTKLYEYMATERPVLGIGPPEGDADRVLRQAGAGRVLGWDDARAIRNFMAAHYADWVAGTPRSGAHRAAIQTYSRASQTHRMAVLLDEVAGDVEYGT